MSNAIDSLHDRIMGFLITTTDPEARKDIDEVLNILLVLESEVRRIESANIKAFEDLANGK